MRQILSIGELIEAYSPDLLHTNLGSCVSVVFYNQRMKFGSMSHYQLPRKIESSKKSSYELTHSHYVYQGLETQIKRFRHKAENIDFCGVYGGCSPINLNKDITLVNESNLNETYKILKDNDIKINQSVVNLKNSLIIELDCSNGKLDCKKLGSY